MLPKAVLTFLAIGALSVNALTVPVARSPAPEPESQELEARFLDVVGTKTKAPKEREIDLDNRQLEPRVVGFIGTALTGIGAAAPVVGLFQKDKKEAKPKREPEIQDLEARIVNLIIPALGAVGGVAPLFKGNGKRDLSYDLSSRGYTGPSPNTKMRAGPR